MHYKYVCKQEKNYYIKKLFVSLFLCPYFMFVVALNKPANLSSQWNEYHIASNAVDGNKNCMTPSSLAGTTSSLQPWLLIQLEMTYHITMVKAFARCDDYRT